MMQKRTLYHLILTLALLSGLLPLGAASPTVAALQASQPVVTADPGALAVEVELGAQDTATLSLQNTGAVATDFRILQQDQGLTPLALASGGPDAFGYRFADSHEPGGPLYQWIDISTSGTLIQGLEDDNYVGPLPMGFEFPFYGAPQTEFFVGSNGIMTFGFGSSSRSNQCPLPDYWWAPNNLIALLWDDLDFEISGAAHYQTFSSCPYGAGSCTIIQFTNVAHYGGAAGSAGTWQAILFETGSILLQFQDAGEEQGADSTTGIENIDGTIGLTYPATSGCNTPGSLQDELAVCFAYPGQTLDCLPPATTWLSFAPITGTLAAGATQVVDLTFDAAQVAMPGHYHAGLAIHSADPTSPLLVPITMTVTPPTTYGQLVGAVTGLGYCDANPAPLANAEVLIESSTGITWTRTTDGNGDYWFWEDAHDGPFTVTTTAPEHLSVQIADIPLNAGATRTEDFALRWDHPCATTATAALSFTLSQGAGTGPAQPLTLSNQGAVALDYELLPVGPPPELPLGTAWETVTPLPAGRTTAAVVADDHRYIHVIGGNSQATGNHPTDSHYRYDTQTDTWETLAPLPRPERNIDGAFINGRIFVPSSSPRSETFVYHTATDEWTSLPPNNGYYGRMNYKAVALDTALYVLGGARDPQSFADVWVLDTLTGQWTESISLPEERFSFSAVASEGVIYVSGGVHLGAPPDHTPVLTTRQFDGAAWSALTPLPTSSTRDRWASNASALGRHGLWLGGGRRDSTFDRTDYAGYYDIQTNAWFLGQPRLSTGRVNPGGAVAADGYFYVIGGDAGFEAFTTNERLYVGYPGLVSTEVPWLTLSGPLSGTLAADDSAQVTLTATALPTMTPGVYTATLLLRNTDFRAARTALPVTLTILGPELNVGIVGSGAVLQDPPPPYALGDVVTLTAQAEPDWRFLHWSGALSSAAPVVTLTLTADQTVTATFAFEGPELHVGIVGNGAVHQDPPPPYTFGDVVTLTAHPDPNWIFTGWSGALSGDDPVITLTLHADQSVTATFTLEIPELHVGIVGNGAVHQDPPPPYALGDVVTLTIQPDPNWRFLGWSGALSGDDPVVTLTLHADQSVTATFALEGPELHVGIVGSGTVDQDPSPPYALGDVVTLTAQPDPRWRFLGWSGALSGDDPVVTLTLHADQIVTATFTLEIPELYVSIVGNGSVNQDPPPPYALGDVVTLTAQPDPDWVFTGWSGALSGDDPVITLTLHADQTVTATFALEGPDPHLTKAVTGDTWPGGAVEYQLTLTNRGLSPTLGIVLTDVLPTALTFETFLENPGATATHANGIITWQGDLPAQETLTLRFSAHIAHDEQLVDTVITNTASFSSTNAGAGAATASFTVLPRQRVYLPMVIRQ